MPKRTIPVENRIRKFAAMLPKMRRVVSADQYKLASEELAIAQDFLASGQIAYAEEHHIKARRAWLQGAINALVTERSAMETAAKKSQSCAQPKPNRRTRKSRADSRRKVRAHFLI
jgi:hypothetical protein